MKFLVLAAGYGTRLEQGIKEEASGRYRSLIGVPKPLIPLANKPLISYWLELVESSGRLTKNDFFIVCNQTNHKAFLVWAQQHGIPPTNIWNDGSTSNDSRLGAVVDIQQMIVHTPQLQNDDLIVVGGDTLFFSDFSLRTLIDRFYGLASNTDMVLWYHDEEVEKTGILETTETGIVTAFLEKPTRAQTNSRKACPCFYMYRQDSLALLEPYLQQTTTAKERDAPGHFPAWLHKQKPIFACQISGRFDIGDLRTYVEADSVFVQQKKSRELGRALKFIVGGVTLLAVGRALWSKVH
jgi:NDP-sugar pyrophosphorylase family protein